MPTNSRSAAELTRDMLQDAAARLKPNGRLIVSTDNPKDSWLRKELKTFFGRVTIERHDDGVCCVARQKPTPAKRKEFVAEFAFRDGERLIPCVTRPGVFCHRRIDAGAARALDPVARSAADKVSAAADCGTGCGGGAVAVAAALRYPDARILAVDSHARAIQCTERTAASNDVRNLNVMLSSTGVVPDDGQWDLFLCNPPYYSDYRISDVFLESALAALRPGGRLHLVTRLTDWHVERMTELFGDIERHEISGYDVLVATRQGGLSAALSGETGQTSRDLSTAQGSPSPSRRLR